MARVLVGICSFIFCFTVSALADRPPEFKKTFQAYTDLVAQEEYGEAIPYAKKALEIASKSDAFDDEERAKLAFNLGYVYLADYQFTASAESFSRAIELFDKVGGNDDLKAEALLFRGQCYRFLKRYDEAKVDLEQALSDLTGTEPHIRLVRAEVLEHLAWVEIAENRNSNAQKFAAEAHKIYSELLTERHPRSLRALIAVSASAYLAGRRREARDTLAKAIDLADKVGMRSQEEGAKPEPGKFTRRQLIQFHREVELLYAIMGRKQDSRHHEQIVADLKKGIPPPNLRVKPIERRAPSYPTRAARKRVMGWALVEYTVRADGSTADIRIIDSAPEGYFDYASIRAVKRWTFEPPTENGKPTEVKNVRTMIEYWLE